MNFVSKYAVDIWHQQISSVQQFSSNFCVFFFNYTFICTIPLKYAVFPILYLKVDDGKIIRTIKHRHTQIKHVIYTWTIITSSTINTCRWLNDVNNNGVLLTCAGCNPHKLPFLVSRLFDASFYPLLALPVSIQYLIVRPYLDVTSTLWYNLLDISINLRGD